ncbi:four-helix bundle copper-binding protein [Telluria sp. Tellsp131]
MAVACRRCAEECGKMGATAQIAPDLRLLCRA